MPPQLDRVQRAKATALRGMVQRAEREFDMHLKICSACQPGPSFARKACDTGWQLAKNVHRTENTLSVFLGVHEDPDDNGQARLW